MIRGLVLALLFAASTASATPGFNLDLTGFSALAVRNTEARQMAFTADRNGGVSDITLYVQKYGTPLFPLNVAVFSDLAGVPNCPQQLGKFSISPESVSTSLQPLTLTCQSGQCNVILSAGQTYWLVVYDVSNDTPNSGFRIGANTNAAFATSNSSPTSICNIGTSISQNPLFFIGGPASFPTATRSATASVTPTITETSTETPSFTVTETYTETPTAEDTSTVTVTPSVTETSTETATPTDTSTATPTATPTDTKTDTVTVTSTTTATSTKTPRFTFTFTAVITATPTRTPVITATQTLRSTFTFTATRTFTKTATRTSTPTETFTESPTPTATSSQTTVLSATPSHTPVVSGTSTPRFTSTYTSVVSATPTRTPVITATQTLRSTFTFTATRTFTKTATRTSTPTETFTESPTPTATETHTEVLSATPTITTTSTPTARFTSTHTSFVTATLTTVVSATPTYTARFTGTYTATPTATATGGSLTSTPTETPRYTFTLTATKTISRTYTVTPSITRTNSAVPSLTFSKTATETASPTPTASPTATASPTRTFTISPTQSLTHTVSPTWTDTRTVSPTPTTSPAAGEVLQGYVDVSGGSVRAITASGQAIYIGGAFTTIDGETRNRFAIISGVTGGLVTTTFPVSIDDGTVLAMAIAGNTIYVGGSFTSVNGLPRAGVAAIDRYTGELLPWDADLGYSGTPSVRGLAYSPPYLYIGGVFTSSHGLTRNFAVATDLTNGIPTSWNPNFNSEVYTLLAQNGKIYAGGIFTTVNGGTTRNRAAAFSPTSSLVDSGWTPSMVGGSVDGLESGPSNTILVYGSFTTVNGSALPRLAQVSQSSGIQTALSVKPNNGVYAATYLGSRIYFGGNFVNVLNGTLLRAGAAAMESSALKVFTWSPSPDSTVYAMKGYGSDFILTGGDFTTIGGITKSYFAVVRSAASTYSTPDVTPTSTPTVTPTATPT